MNRGKRGKRGRNNGDDYDVKVSKKLSWVLRHGAVKCGLAIDSAGYVKIDDLLQNQRFAHLNLAII